MNTSKENKDFSLELFQKNISIELLFESIAEGVVIINDKNKIVYINSMVEELFGFKKNEVINKELNIILPEKYHQSHLDHVNEYFKNPRIRPMGIGLNLSGRKKNNTEIPLDISLSYFQTKEGVYSIAFITDNTARKKAEADLEKRNMELDAYAHTIAHDLNSTLNGIIGFSELLLYSGNDYSEQEKNNFLEEIVKISQKMSSTVHELLVFATMKKEDLELKEVNMNQIVKESLNRLNYIINKNDAQIILPENFDNCLGYGPWIEEVWYNFINNAIKYGGRPPVVELICEKTNNEFIKYSIKDNGKGLKEELLKDIFKPQNKAEKGFGLGLSIVKRIIKKLDGYVDVESEIGKGCEFSFYLKKINK